MPKPKHITGTATATILIEVDFRWQAEYEGEATIDRKYTRKGFEIQRVRIWRPGDRSIELRTPGFLSRRSCYSDRTVWPLPEEYIADIITNDMEAELVRHEEQEAARKESNG